MESNILILVGAFLSTVMMVGIVVRRYLRQVQKNVIPEDSYNAARTEYYTRKERQVHTPITRSLVVSRLFLFYATFVGIFALWLLLDGIINGRSAQDITSLVLLSVVASPLILLIFPSGVQALFLPDSPGVLVGYIFYLIICYFGIVAKNRRSFIIFYLIFITLLIMNIIGCSRVSIRF